MPLPALEPPRTDELFLHELREGLHTMAQPLTLLQTQLEAALMLGDYTDPAATEALLAALLEQAGRACSNFHALQLLAGTAYREKHQAASTSGKDA